MRRIRRVRSDDGSAAVEFAIIVPVLILFVIGVLEFSLVLRDYLGVSSSVRVGARIASSGAGSGPGCDDASPPTCTNRTTPSLAQAAADAIQRAGTAMPQNSIDEIWVYQANSSGFPGTATSQATSTCTTNCVRYIWVDSTSTTAGRFRYGSGSWDSRTINACINTSGAMAVGVYMKATHPFLTRVFVPSLSVSDRSVMMFEPLPNNQCLPSTHA
jgi:Flp pilus assembly protein TadG